MRDGTGLSPPTVFALRALGLGDLLAAVPALRALRAHHPAHRVVLGGPVPLRWLVTDAGLVDAVVPVPPLAPLPVPLRPGDTAVNLHGRGPASTTALSASRPGRLIAFATRQVPATAGSARWRAGEHERVRWCRLLRHHGIPADPDAIHLPVPDRALAPHPPGATVLHPGSSDPARRWPPEAWSTLARRLAANGHRVVVTGGPGEHGLAAGVAASAGLPAEAVSTGNGIAALASLVAHARCLVSVDTGPAHLAYAYRTPSVVLFGSVPPSEWGPPAGSPHTVIWRPGEGRRRGDPLRLVTAGEVEEAVHRLPPPPRRGFDSPGGGRGGAQRPQWEMR